MSPDEQEEPAATPLNLAPWFHVLRDMTASDEIYVTLRVKGQHVHLVYAGVKPVNEQVWPQDEAITHTKTDYLG